MIYPVDSVIQPLNNRGQMFTLFTVHHVGGPRRSSNILRLHTKLYNFAQNISTNISTLRQHTYLKRGKLSSLFIVYNITISWLYPGTAWFLILMRDSGHTLLGNRMTPHINRHNFKISRILGPLTIKTIFVFNVMFFRTENEISKIV